jgi:hypothetical protein
VFWGAKKQLEEKNQSQEQFSLVIFDAHVRNCKVMRIRQIGISDTTNSTRKHGFLEKFDARKFSVFCIF